MDLPASSAPRQDLAPPPRPDDPPDAPPPAPPRLAGAWPFVVLGGALALYALLAINQAAIWGRASWFARPRAGTDETGFLVAGYVAINAALLALYAAIVRISAGRTGEGWSAAVLGLPVLVLAGFAWVGPTFSVDVWSYLAHGATTLLPYDSDAYSTPPRLISALPYGQELLARGWNPAPGTSPYGPVWTLLESAIVGSGLGVDAGMHVIKAIGAGAAFGSAALVWRILGLVRPEARLAGTAAFLWNPVVVVELAGEGHIDGLMVFLALLGLYGVLLARPAAGLVSTVAGGLVKYLPALFLLPQLAYLWRRATGDRRAFVAGVLPALAIAAAMAGLAFLPFLGPHLFDGVLRSNAGGAWPLWPSVSGLVYSGLLSWFPALDQATGRTLLLGGVVGLVVLVQSMRAATPERLIRACATIAVTYVYLVSAIFWPWYALLPIAFLVMEPGRRPWILVLVLTAGSRLLAPLGALPADVPFQGVFTWGTLAVVLIALGTSALARLVPARGTAAGVVTAE